MRSTPKLAALLAAAALAACGAAPAPVAPQAPGAAGAPWGPQLSIAPATTNGDFEADVIGASPPTKWTVLTYLNSAGVSGTSTAPPSSFSALNLSGLGTAVNETFVVGGATALSQVDPDLGSTQSFRYPAYGIRAARVNYKDATASGKNKNSNVLRQVMTTDLTDVDPSDGQIHVRFAVAPVLENPAHAFNQQPYFFVELLNLTRGTTLYTSFNFAGQAGVPWHTTTSAVTGNAAQWLDWQLIDIFPGNAALAPGDQVQLTVVGAGCSLGGHFGRIYVDGIGATVPGPFVTATAPASVNAGSTLTYTFRYSNGGTGAVLGAHVDLVTPPQTTYASIVPPAGVTCTAPAAGQAGTISCPLGTLNPGTSGSFTVTVNVLASATGSIVNGNYLIGSLNALQLLGAKVTTSVISSSTTTANLNVTKTASVASIAPGDATHACAAPPTGCPTPLYTITLNNPSAYTFRSNVGRTVSFSDVVPAAITGVTWYCAATGTTGTTSKCRDASGNGAITLAGTGNTISLSPRLGTGTGKLTIQVYGTVSASAAGTISNTATAAVNGITDPDLSDNTASASMTVGTPLALTLTKAGGNANGTVTSAPAGLSCGTACGSVATSFASGSQVVLFATPVTGASFTGWSGTGAPLACTGTPAPTSCAVTMDAAKAITATFAAKPAVTAAAKVYAYAGAAQSARTSAAFGSPLVALVTDATDAPVAAGTTVTFTLVPVGGASATLSAGTATTTASGLASVTATANATAGSYTVNATVSGGTRTGTFALTNVGPPATITYVNGGSSTDPQVAPVSTAFAAPLLAVVKDAAGNVVPGAAITFTAPGSGGSASLSNGVTSGATVTATSDASGLVSVVATANAITGSYNVVASASGATPATFYLQNATTGPANVFIVSGTPQTTAVSAGFATPLEVVVADASGNALAGQVVTFTVVPVGGASATLTGATTGTTVTATTGASGLASVTALANATGGTYTVTATVGALPAATFTLTNDGGQTIQVQAGSPQTTTVGAPFALPLQVLVLDANGVAFEGAVVTFAAPASGASATLSAGTATTDVNGLASVTATATATSGSYAVVASTPNAPTTASFLLSNQCTLSSQCPGATPVCDTSSHTCAACASDLQCSTKDASKPYCDVSGACFACTGDAQCSGTAPICSQASNSCAGCTTDAQCANKSGSAPYCVVATGACTASFTITASAGANGSISPSGAQVVTPGASLGFTITPAGGYHVADVLVDGVSVGAVAAYTFSSVAASHTIVATFAPSSSSTALAAAPAAPSAWGQSVTFTATVSAVSPAGTPSGTVSFFDGAVPLCTAVPLSSGAAGCTTSALALATHSVTAVYGGDGTYPGSTSSILSYAVGKASTDTVLSAPATSTYGQLVTLTANVLITSGAGTPTGSVAFMDGASIVCTATVASQSASCSTSALGAGTHSLTAVYGGDGYFLASTSLAGGVDVAKATPSITWADPATLTYGTALSGTQLNASSATPGSFVYTPAAGTVLGAGAGQLLSVSFTPTDATNYSATSATAHITVNKATPSITWADPAAITYGTALSTTQLNASSATPGSFVYTPAAGTVLGAGASQLLSVSFTPTDSTNYSSTSAMAHITVNKATPSITWADPAAITYGTALSGTQLNASADVPGSFVYTPVAGTLLGAGAGQLLSASFTPTDATNYSATSATAHITVNKATPSITWADPAAITYGTALSATQLNASAATPGTFVYTPAVGTVLGAGAGQLLSVSFTPTDAANYSATSATAHITVNKATPSITWADPAAITYGTALSATQLNSSADVPGSFIYTPAIGTVLGAGASQLLSVSFTPTDAANYSATSATAHITVNKATPSITWADPAAITYGTALSTTQLNASSATPGSFVYTPAAGTVLGAGASQLLSVSFTPTDSTNYSSTSATAHITVNKATPSITWADPAAITYGTALSATQLNASAATPGTFVYTPAAGTVLGAGAGQLLSVSFTPTDATNYSATSATAHITVNKATPSITWADPAAITYGTALSATQLNASSATPGTFVYTPAAGTVLGAGASQLLSVSFTPTDSANYSSTSATAHITVNKATPVITWADPAAIIYGTALSGTQLNASSANPGTFVYTPAAGTVLGAGASQLLSASFTPTDSANYSSTSATAHITVNKATPVITWADPAAITYGTALSGTQLNASADVPGSFVYTPAAGTVLGAGAGQLLSVSFTPTDTANYSAASATAHITVNKATPVITWADPAAITYGTVLGAAQLNATASVPGTLAYTPAAGMKLGAGLLQPLSVTFTPTDAANYSAASKTVHLDVSKADPVLTWADPAGITYGTALGATQLDASADVPGSFAYTPAAGVKLGAGLQQPLSVTFTPADPADYNPASKIVHLDVAKADPVITWADPAGITYGTALGATQLSATADVPGTFAYTPAAGVKLGAGLQQPLSVAFTPADPADYNAASKLVHLDVARAAQTLAFAPPASRGYGEAPLDLATYATGGASGSPVTFSLLSGPATLAGATLTIVGVGTVVVAADQAGTANYLPAARVQATIDVTRSAVTLAVSSSRNPSRAGRPVTFTVTASGAGSTPTGSITLLDDTAALGTVDLVDGVARLTTRTLRKGLHPISARLADGTLYLGATALLDGGQRVENSPPVAGAGTALRLGPGHALRATAAAGGHLDASAAVELWALADWSLAAEAGASPTLARLGSATGTRWALGVTPDRTGLVVTLGAAPPATVPAPALADRAWHQVALLAGEAAVAVVFDGVEIGSIVGHLDGAQGDTLTLGDGFTGALDELRLAATARTLADLAADARRPLLGTEPWLLGLWRMDDADGLQLFGAGPAGLDLALELATGAAPADALEPSGAWRHRTATRATPLAPVDAGYDLDGPGDGLVLSLTAPAAHGTAAVDQGQLQVGYLGAEGFSGDDAFTFRLTDADGAHDEYTIDVTVTAPLSCQSDADCAGGDICGGGSCVAPADLVARSGGCGCTSGGGEALALWSMLALVLTGRRRRPGQPLLDGGRP